MNIKNELHNIREGLTIVFALLVAGSAFSFLPFIWSSFILGIVSIALFIFIGINSKKLGFVNIALLFLLGMFTLAFSYGSLMVNCDLEDIEVVNKTMFRQDTL